MGNVNSQPVYTQMLVGLVTGMLTGFILTKIGRVIAFLLGLTILILELSHNQGYINLETIYESLAKVKSPIKSKCCATLTKAFYENTTVSTAFTGGLFLGFAFA